MTIPDFMFNYVPQGRHNPKGMTYYTDPKTGQQTTFEDCKERTYAFSRALANEYNVGSDDVVLIFSPNSQEFSTCCWATHQLG